MYTIRIRYATGDSYDAYNTEDDVGMVWNELEHAQEALACIKAHYNAVEHLDSYHVRRNEEEYIEQFKNEKWYVETEHAWNFKYYINVPNVDGTDVFRCYAFWQGYYDYLIDARIIVKSDFDTESDLNYFSP